MDAEEVRVAVYATFVRLGRPPTAAELAAALSDALQAQVPVPPVAALGPGRMPSGHWQRFASVLDDAFALLGPVAARLGYTA